MNIIVEKILSIPKSLYVCLRLLPFSQAIKLPIHVRYNASILSTKGYVEFKKKVHSGMLNIGFEKIGIFDKKFQRAILQIDGHILIEGEKNNFGQGAKLCILENGKLILGNNINNTGQMQLICNKRIQICDNALISWDTLIMDTDFHEVIDLTTNHHSDMDGEIYISEGVWIGARSTILKNSFIPKGCIVAANACCNKKYKEEYCLLAGTPATIKKRNITLKQKQQNEFIDISNKK